MESKHIKFIFPQGEILVDSALIKLYPESVFSSYLLEHPHISELHIDKCNLDIINLETFIRIYDFLSNKIKMSDLSNEDIKIIDKIGFSSPMNIKLQSFCRAYTEKIYEQFEILLKNKIRYIQINNQDVSIAMNICNSIESFYLLRLYKFIINYETYIVIETGINSENSYAIPLGFISPSDSKYEKLSYNFDESIKLYEILKIAIHQFCIFIFCCRGMPYHKTKFHQCTSLKEVPKKLFLKSSMQRCEFLIDNRHYNYVNGQIVYAQKNIIKSLTNMLVDGILIDVFYSKDKIIFSEKKTYEIAHIIINTQLI
jgi:hypothetical protein